MLGDPGPKRCMMMVSTIIFHQLQLPSPDSAAKDVEMGDPGPFPGPDEHAPEPAPLLPSRNYIEILSHPDSGVRKSTIIPLDSHTPAPPEGPENFLLEELQRPWAPFRTRADFEYTATAVVGGLSKEIIDLQLRGITGPWSVGGSKLTIQNSAEMEQSLAAAREYVVRVCAFAYMILFD
jgi:hypothetical protein